MLAIWKVLHRTYGMPLVSLFLVLSFAFIPVRCDASSAPHSIFVSPNFLNATGEHQHHTGSTDRLAPAKSIAHHSPLSLDAHSATLGDHQPAPDATSSTDSSAGDRSASKLGVDNDPGSQQPVGATLDLPPTTATSESSLLLLLDREMRLLVFGPAAILHGITSPPEAPPPEIA